MGARGQAGPSRRGRRIGSPRARGRRATKVYYATQIAAPPPTFVIFVNDVALFTADYRRYMEGAFREALGFKEIPLRMALEAAGARGGGRPAGMRAEVRRRITDPEAGDGPRRLLWRAPLTREAGNTPALAGTRRRPGATIARDAPRSRTHARDDHASAALDRPRRRPGRAALHRDPEGS